VNYSNSQRAGVIFYLTALLFGGYKAKDSLMLLTEFNQEAFAKVMQNERIEEKIKIALTIDTLQNQ